ncbi:MAG: CbiX/SirB N-terminal domain-containing protein [Gemmatimonadales bacterium]|jgi:sirohydrochlorin ferrochelatase
MRLTLNLDEDSTVKRFASILLLFCLPTAVPAQTPPTGDAPVTGTILVAHGADAEWNAPVHRLAAAAETGGPVEVSLLMGDSATVYRFQDAVDRLVEKGAGRMVIVPLLASSHSGHFEQIRYLAGERDTLRPGLLRHLEDAGIHRPTTDVPMKLTPAIDASMEIAGIVGDRALRLATVPAEQSLFVIGHGPGSAEDYAEWMANLRPVAAAVQERTGFRDVKIGLVRDDAAAPVRAEAVRRIREIIELQAEATGREVVVVPLLISKGYISTRKFPEDLRGLPIAYDGEGLLPHPALAEWIERRVREAEAELDSGVVAAR